jgi:ParB family chromosome partitioning protein
MNVEIARIKIGPRFRQDLGSIEALAASIAEVGLLHPVVLAKDGTLIAGKRRIEAAKTLGWTEIPATMIDLKEIVKGEFAENVARKDFTPSEAVGIAEALEPELREQARERQREHGGTAPGRPAEENTSGNFPQVNDTGRARDQVARFVGISGRTLDKARAVVEAAKEDPEKFGTVVEKMDRTGKVEPAYKHVSDDSYEWYTPSEYLEAAREVMGSFDLDPASCAEANEIVKARCFYALGENGLNQEWGGNIWLNPPYNMPLVAQFTAKAIADFESGKIQQAIILVNNATDTEWFHNLLSAGIVCFTRGRIRFWTTGGSVGLSTRQGQAFFYLGKKSSGREKFVSTFSEFGAVMQAMEPIC